MIRYVGWQACLVQGLPCVTLISFLQLPLFAYVFMDGGLVNAFLQYSFPPVLCV